MALLPTKKISALPAFVAPLTGNEEFEAVQIGNSVKVPSRAFVLPTDSLVTLSAMGGSLPGSRQLVSSPTIQVTDNGAGSTVQLDALGAGALPGNPTSMVGLTPVNGVAVTWMRSDAAPALDQSIVPTWTGLHTFTAGALSASDDPYFRLREDDAAVDNRVWDWAVVGEQLQGRVGDDAEAVFASWIEVDRTLNVVDSIDLLSTALLWNGSPILSQATAFANPTAQVGLVAVNGVATTAMRSDAAPALDQAIAPVWTGVHSFTAGVDPATPSVRLQSNRPTLVLFESDAAANNRAWYVDSQSEQFRLAAMDDVGGTSTAFMVVDRTLNVIDSIALTSTALTWNGSPIITHATGFANPTAQIGLATVNGVATTAMRSDAAPALNQSIAPTWTGQHLWSSTSPALRLFETGATATNRAWQIDATSEQFGIYAASDDFSGFAAAMLIDRTGVLIDSVTFPRSVRSIYAGTAAAPNILMSGTATVLAWTETDAAADNRNWDLVVSGENLQWRLVDDAISAATTFMRVDRTGMTVDNVTFPSTVNFEGNAVGTTGAISLNNTTPLIVFNKTNGGVNEKFWRQRLGTATFIFDAMSDDGSTVSAWLSATRSGTTISAVGLGPMTQLNMNATTIRIDTTTATTVGAAGGASALPATPTGYWSINVNGTARKIPYYNN